MDILQKIEALLSDVKNFVLGGAETVADYGTIALTAFAHQFATPLGAQCLTLAKEFVDDVISAKMTIAESAENIVSQVPALLIADAEAAVQVAMDAMRVYVTAAKGNIDIAAAPPVTEGVQPGVSDATNSNQAGAAVVGAVVATAGAAALAGGKAAAGASAAVAEHIGDNAVAGSLG